MPSFDVFMLASLIGVFAFALSGFLAGVRKNLDIMGVFILAFLTGNGGGIVRDVFVGKTPTALTDAYGFAAVIAAFIAGCLIVRLCKGICNADDSCVEGNSLFVLSDSIGLVAFSFTGTLIGIEAGLGLLGVMVLSFITAAGGGVVVLCL